MQTINRILFSKRIKEGIISGFRGFFRFSEVSKLVKLKEGKDMKMIKISLFAMLLMIGTSGMGFAATLSTVAGATTVVVGTAPIQATLTSSSNVMLSYDGAAQSYGLTSQHLNGTRVYATWSGSSSILYTQVGKVAGTNTAVSPTTAQPSSGWTAQ